MRVLQINTTVNFGSHGKIAEQIGQLVLDKGGESFFAFGRDTNSSKSTKIKVGNKIDFYHHVLISRVFDRHGFGSKRSTESLIKKIHAVNPDIIHLHNIHGYFINIRILFEFLSKFNKPVVWTLHDCWSFTGHCAFYTFVKCDKWQKHCEKCPQINSYPKSWVVDNSDLNFREKKKLFNSLNRLIIVPVSYWLSGELSNSFLKRKSKRVIQNGVDLEVFKPKIPSYSFYQKYGLSKNKKYILGVASIWENRKGFSDFLILSDLIPIDYEIILIGLTKRQLETIKPHKNIRGFLRTGNASELASFYSLAMVFFNPTREDNYPTTILESLSCGTPVITYDTGGCKESVQENLGYVVQQGDFVSVLNAINEITSLGKNHYSKLCRSYSELHFDKNKKFQSYIKLYEELMNNES